MRHNMISPAFEVKHDIRIKDSLKEVSFEVDNVALGQIRFIRLVRYVDDIRRIYQRSI